jgi:hypothetical protein
MTANGAKGALVNIPDVTSIPFFTTVPVAPLSPLDPDFGPLIPELNATYGLLNQAFAFIGVPERSIQFSTTAASRVVIQDNDLPNVAAQLQPVLKAGFEMQLINQGVPPAQADAIATAQSQIFAQQFGQARQATEDELLTFTSATVVGTLNQTRFNQLTMAGVDPGQAAQLSVNGVTFPLENQFVLTEREQERVTTAQSFYNSVIEMAAINNDLAYVDARAALEDVASGGVMFDGGLLTDEYAAGGAFSLDAVHPTGRGYAFTANFILEAINDKYGSTIPPVNIGQYPSVQPSDGM